MIFDSALSAPLVNLLQQLQHFSNYFNAPDLTGTYTYSA